MERVKAHLLDEKGIDRALVRIAHEIVERDPDAEEYLLIGVRRRGAPLAAKIAENMRSLTDAPVIDGALDISLYRDDLKELSDMPTVGESFIPVDSIHGKIVILVDDVIYTGRTVRAAMDALMELGRPAAIRLAALIDRGHRELPIRPDFVGKNVPTSHRERVEVRLPQIDGEQSVVLIEDDSAEDASSEPNADRRRK